MDTSPGETALFASIAKEGSLMISMWHPLMKIPHSSTVNPPLMCAVTRPAPNVVVTSPVIIPVSGTGACDLCFHSLPALFPPLDCFIERIRLSCSVPLLFPSSENQGSAATPLHSYAAHLPPSDLDSPDR